MNTSPSFFGRTPKTRVGAPSEPPRKPGGRLGLEGFKSAFWFCNQDGSRGRLGAVGNTKMGEVWSKKYKGLPGNSKSGIRSSPFWNFSAKKVIGTANNIKDEDGGEHLPLAPFVFTAGGSGRTEMAFPKEAQK